MCLWASTIIGLARSSHFTSCRVNFVLFSSISTIRRAPLTLRNIINWLRARDANKMLRAHSPHHNNYCFDDDLFVFHYSDTTTDLATSSYAANGRRSAIANWKIKTVANSQDPNTHTHNVSLCVLLDNALYFMQDCGDALWWCMWAWKRARARARVHNWNGN